MSTLKELSAIKIAESIIEAPPMIQEMIANTTIKQIESNFVSKLEELLPFLVEKILENTTIDYYSLYSHIDKRIISMAINIAKNAVKTVEEPRYFIYKNLIDAYDPDSNSEHSEDSNIYDYNDENEEELF